MIIDALLCPVVSPLPPHPLLNKTMASWNQSQVCMLAQKTLCEFNPFPSPQPPLLMLLCWLWGWSVWVGVGIIHIPAVAFMKMLSFHCCSLYSGLTWSFSFKVKSTLASGLSYLSSWSTRASYSLGFLKHLGEKFSTILQQLLWDSLSQYSSTCWTVLLPGMVQSWTWFYYYGWSSHA